MSDPKKLGKGIAKAFAKSFSREQLQTLLSHSFPEERPPTPPAPVPPELAKYRDDPVGFATDILGIHLTPDIERVFRALPGRVKMEAGHGVGKSFGMAAVALWWHFTRNPSVVVCNGPTSRSVEDILWAEIRLLIDKAKYPLSKKGLSPKAAEFYSTPDHWMRGYTTGSGESYQGRHRQNMLFLMDEDEGIGTVFWTTTNTMYRPDEGDCWLTGCNPITTSSQSYLESQLVDPEGGPKWKLFTLSSLDHPNVVAGLRGEKPPVPGAVTLGQVKQWVKDWTSSIDDPLDRQDGDLEWPPHSGKFVRPGPMFLSRVLGQRPTSGIDSVWSPAAWDKAITTQWDARICWQRNSGITIGVDAAGYGDDDAAFHVRCGPISLHHESHNGWSPDRCAGRIKQLCREWSMWYNRQATDPRPPLRPTDVQVVIEFDGGFGIAIHSHRGEYEKWVGVTVGGRSEMIDPNSRPLYANLRSEIWLESAKSALAGQIDLSRLPPEVRDRLRLQLLAPYYENRPDGTRIVEAKKDIKKRLGRSPDDADAFILSHFKPVSWVIDVLESEKEW